MNGQPLRYLALGFMLGELGREVREVNDSNYSPRIEEYFANLDPPVRLFDRDGDGVKEGYPWCGAVVQFATDGAARSYGVRNPLDDVLREAYVQDYYDLAEERGWLILPEEAGAGDLVMYRFGEDPDRWNHIGLVFHGLIDDTFRAVEGNTTPPANLPGQTSGAEREGGGVWAKDRRVSPGRVCFARWDEGIKVVNP